MPILRSVSWASSAGSNERILSLLLFSPHKPLEQKAEAKHMQNSSRTRDKLVIWKRVWWLWKPCFWMPMNLQEERKLDLTQNITMSNDSELYILLYDSLSSLSWVHEIACLRARVHLENLVYKRLQQKIPSRLRRIILCDIKRSRRVPLSTWESFEPFTTRKRCHASPAHGADDVWVPHNGNLFFATHTLELHLGELRSLRRIFLFWLGSKLRTNQIFSELRNEPSSSTRGTYKWRNGTQIPSFVPLRSVVFRDC